MEDDETAKLPFTVKFELKVTVPVWLFVKLLMSSADGISKPAAIDPNPEYNRLTDAPNCGAEASEPCLLSMVEPLAMFKFPFGVKVPDCRVSVPAMVRGFDPGFGMSTPDGLFIFRVLYAAPFKLV